MIVVALAVAAESHEAHRRGGTLGGVVCWEGGGVVGVVGVLLWVMA